MQRLLFCQLPLWTFYVDVMLDRKKSEIVSIYSIYIHIHSIYETKWVHTFIYFLVSSPEPKAHKVS